MSGAQNTSFWGTSGAKTAVAAYSFLIGRILCRAAVFALLVCGIMPQCTAAKLRHHYAAGVYLTDDGQLLRALAQRNPGTYWIDGYQMTVSKETKICWHDMPLQFGSFLNWAGQPISMPEMSSPCNNDPPNVSSRLGWLQYQGTEKFDYFTPSMTVTADRIDMWETESNGKIASQPPAKAAWRTLCASTDPHERRYPNEGPIDVVCDAKLNQFIEHVFTALLKPSAMAPDAPIATRKLPSFYIVRPFRVSHNYAFEIIDGSRASCGSTGGNCMYRRPRTGSTVQEIAYAPDGSVLIPDTALIHLTNEAELAALLSYSAAATDQQFIGQLFQVQRFKRHVLSLSYKASGRENSDETGQFISKINEAELRLGINKMYLAEYDIRYAPFAWAVEQGKQIKGPVDQPNKHMPWYATYAFNYISQLYPNVDYSKLKRGEVEYQEFLGELRKADPEAFAAKK
ncbi:MAG: hypothetical protein HIU91_15470 [Acidobacteria bacterium]|nr:hypothetical protein [Acidobacteriota bacterium]